MAILPSSSMLLMLLLAVSPLVYEGVEGHDFLYLVLQWPGSLCNTGQPGMKCCKPEMGTRPEDFGIAGLWPKLTSGADPPASDCSPSPQNRLEIKTLEVTQVDLYQQLVREWPRRLCQADDKYWLLLWDAAWMQHGSCTKNPAVPQRDYFDKAVQRRAKLGNLVTLLQSKSILPGSKTPYPTKDISEVIQQATGGFLAGLVCNKDSSGNIQLYQVYVCVSKKGGEFIKCPTLPTTATLPQGTLLCPPTGSIMFPAFKED